MSHKKFDDIHEASVQILNDVGFHIPDDEIPGLNIPTGFPLVYELDNRLTPVAHFYLGDKDEIRKATATVVEQAHMEKK